MKDIEKAQIILKNIADVHHIPKNQEKYILNGAMSAVLEIKRLEATESEVEMHQV